MGQTISIPVGWVEPVLALMGFVITQPILREAAIVANLCEGAKPITTGELKNEKRTRPPARRAYASERISNVEV